MCSTRSNYRMDRSPSHSIRRANVPLFVLNPRIARAALGKQHTDEVQYAQLVKANSPVVPIHSGLDGGMNRVFLAQVGGSIPPARVPSSSQPSPENNGSLASRLLGWFGWKSASQAQVASADSTILEHGAHSAATGSILTPKAKLLSQSYASASANPNELYANDPPGYDQFEVQQPIAALQMPSWRHIAASVPVSTVPPEAAEFSKAAGAHCKRRRQAFHSMRVGRSTLAKAASDLLPSVAMCWLIGARWNCLLTGLSPATGGHKRRINRSAIRGYFQFGKTP